MTVSETKLQSVAKPFDGESASWLECLACRARFQLAPLIFGCPQCGDSDGSKPLEMRYAKAAAEWRFPFEAGVWRWKHLLPDIAPRDRTSLGEGGTALLEIGGGQGPRIFLKNETTNPTWSWKDRPNAVSVSAAKYFGFKKVVAISTGNHGNAMAAMAAAAGLEATVICNEDAPALQLAMMQNYGATVLRGGDPEAIIPEMLRQDETYPCTIFGGAGKFCNPFGVEGFKTIAFEIWQQLGGVPDRVFVPVGSGDGIYGIWKGFRELAEQGLVNSLPRMIACQTAGANSLVRAFRAGQAQITPLAEARTVASSLAERAVGKQALDALYASQGSAVEVTDDQALGAMEAVTRRGIALEPSSAVALAAIGNFRTTADYSAETWVSIGTGAAPKWPSDVLRNFKMPQPIKASV